MQTLNTQAERRPKTVCGHPADQVVKRGGCVWLRSGFDDIWCLQHRQLAPELRQLTGLTPCAAQLSPRLQVRAALSVLPELVPELMRHVADDNVRMRVIDRLAPDRLGWAKDDPSWLVRCVAASKATLDELDWAFNDPHSCVRSIAANRLRAPLVLAA